MSGTLHTEPGRFPRGEAPPENFAFYSTPYAPLVRGQDRSLANGPFGYLYEPAFSLQGDAYATYTMGTQGGRKFDLILVRCTPTGLPPLRFSTRDFSDGALMATTAERNLFWDGRLVSIKIGKSCINALQGGGVVGISTSELVLDNDDMKYNDIVSRQTYLNHEVTILGLRLYGATPWLNSTDYAMTIFKGTITGISQAGKRIKLTLGDATNFGATKNLVPDAYKYDGATNNGGEALKDQPMPCVIGDVFNISPVYLGQVDLGAGTLPTFQVHFGAINDVPLVRVRGASMAKVLSGTPTVGQFRSFNSLGKFQTGSTPSGALTCNVQGASGGTYGYDTAVANVIRKAIVDIAGAVTSASTPDATFANLLSLTAGAGFYWGPQKATLVQALNTLCSGTLSTVHGLRDGRIGAFFLDLLTPPVFSITDADCLEAIELPLPADYLPRPDEIEMGYEFNYTKLSDIADTVTGDIRSWLGQESKKYTVATDLKGFLPKPRKFENTSLFKDLASATNRVALLKAFFERNPRIVQIVTPYYMGQVELGMTATVTLTQLGVQGRDMVVAEYQEDFVTGRLQLILIG